MKKKILLRKIFWKGKLGYKKGGVSTGPDLEKTIVLWTLKFWEYRFGGKKRVNDDKFEPATKQCKSNI